MKTDKIIIDIIDDDEIILRMMTGILSKYYNVRTFNSAKEYIEFLNDNSIALPKLIISDIRMPDISGLELLKYIKNINKFKNIPVLMLTSAKEDEVEEEALALGASDFISKPFKASILLSRVKIHIYNKIARDLLEEKVINFAENLSLKNKELFDAIYSDTLTGLYNINYFKSYLNDLIQKNENGILLLIDIYQFTHFNKTYGIATGDLILKHLGAMLKEKLSNELIFRIGSDEFAIYYKHISNEKLTSILSVIDFIFKNINTGDKVWSIPYNIGIVTSTESKKNAEELLEMASIALKKAKLKGANSHVFYEDNIEKEFSKIIFARELISKAIKNKLFIFQYQPYYDPYNLSIKGFEALVRIKDGDEIYSPYLFIEELERSEFLSDFEDILLTEIKKVTEKWNLPVSFNISPRSFNLNLLKKLKDVGLTKLGTIEVTERLLLENIDEAIEVMDNIKNFTTLKIAIDDFGTDYSSLKYLKDLPIDILKIDITFVRSMLDSLKDRAVVEVLIELCKKIGVTSLAEGVENNSQMDMLKNMGVDLVQGFLLAKPMFEFQVDTLLEKNNT
ncbi:conserved hypothetical protein [Deferribacter desulfuricans SSM1]|uniref:Signal transduction response regulator n=1 Tax=Deferribacter desulfuricans (strain DSM 14783 / JCM 11476 / NBRC 101012 / SSM1) TaxID=639282 RepID=D3PDK6_DEFDS|nr:EAL domain-containing protein [Deferribacter desulfuricans]BAI80679.1 conserved hypothetical protein [Deferribacter desulfuricans SSM1]